MLFTVAVLHPDRDDDRHDGVGGAEQVLGGLEAAGVTGRVAVCGSAGYPAGQSFLVRLADPGWFQVDPGCFGECDNGQLVPG